MPVFCDECLGAEAREDEERERERKQNESAQRIARSGVPIKFQGLTLAGAEGPAVESLNRWVGGDLLGVVLRGPTGVGKTHLAACAACDLIASGKTVCWMSVPALIAQARADFGSPERKAATFALLEGNMPLVLDDIDKVNPTPFALDLLYLAVNKRYDARTRLIVTTNLTFEEMTERLTEPITSRLAEHCVGHVIEGDDRRLA